ncbi:MFS transporter [Thermogymnomonas acidicola]|uniref:MFS transporter n=1 Tax=Thermogymnomonas acidicola TaxID=399579 RepID=UPI001E5260A2|nr:MFS transporter [Thermogymnomonas acidicola]
MIELEGFEVLDNSRMTSTHRGLFILSSMGLFLDGYDLSIITLAMLVIPAQLSLTLTEHVLVNVSSFVGMAIGAPLLGWFADRFGRKVVFGMDLILFVVFAILSGLSVNFYMLFVSRLLLGVGIGGDYPISSTMLSEFAPVRNRGSLLIGMVGLYWVGSLMASAMNYAFAPFTDFWRYTFVIGGLMAIPIILLRLRIPESPRWLVSRGRYREAEESIERITGSRGLSIANGRPQRSKLSEIMRGRYALMAFFVFTAWFFFDVAAYGIGFYSPVILSELGFDRHIRLIAEGGMIIAVGAIVGYVVAFGLAENIGRRYLTIVGFLVMTVLLFLGSFVRISGPLKLIPFFFLFVLFEQWVGAVTLFYPAELFPTSVRSTVQGTSTAISRIGAIMGVVLFPYFSVFSSLEVFAFFSLVGLVIAIALAPETKRKSLEKIVQSMDVNAKL